MNIHKTVIHPRFSDADPAGIVYFARYAGYFDEAYIRAMRELGMVWDDHLTHDYFKPIVESKVNFHSPLRPGDEAIVYTAITEIADKFYRSQHLITIYRDGREMRIASGYLGRVTVDTKLFRPKKIPEFLKNHLSEYRVDEKSWLEFISKYH